MGRIRERVWEIVERGKAGDRLSRGFDLFIISLVLLNTVAIILESVEAIEARFHTHFRIFEYTSVSVFVVEFAARLWSCTAEEDFRRPIVGRLRFMFQLLPLMDVLAIAPTLIFVAGFDLRFLRLMRIFRVMRLASLVRYSASLQLLVNVLRNCYRELAVTVFAIGVLLIVSSCLMYFAEHKAQPDVFPDIPHTMWWAVITITTVGYGDAYPITIAGKLLTAVIALLGVGVLALPTAIIGGSFVEQLAQSRKRMDCPHCGKEIR